MKIAIAGAGFAGCVAARELAEAGHGVTVYERRDHIGGNAYDYYDKYGVLVHKYGPHCFHTNSDRIWDWLSIFTEWRPFELRVQALVDGMLLPIPINATTVRKLCGWDIVDTIQMMQEKIPVITAEDQVRNSVGAYLGGKFFCGYTKKAWGRELSELSPSVTARIPYRLDTEDRYFLDKHQGIPERGYTRMFNNMLAHPNITVHLNAPFPTYSSWDKMIWTGPIDAYFDYCYGKLPYRSRGFDWVHFPVPLNVLNTPIVNFPGENTKYLRAIEYKQITGQKCEGTTLALEYGTDEGEPFYPIPAPENEELYRWYRDLSTQAVNTIFVGRLAEYRYYNMDQVVGAALKAVEPWTT